MIIGCDYHPAFQQIAFVDTDSGAGQIEFEFGKLYRDCRQWLDAA